MCSLAAIAALLAGTLGAATPAPAISDPDAIFANARAAWSQGGYPHYATYATVVDYFIGSRHVRSTWDTIEDFRHEVVFARKFSREETAHPTTPHGINIAIPFLSSLGEEQPQDPVGHVAFAVDQSYGVAKTTTPFSAAMSASDFDKTSSTLSLIGRTGVVARIYTIRLVETLTDEHGVTYHLSLVPLAHAERNRLRELWIDGATWLVQRATVAGIGNRAPLTGVSWRIDFAQILGATYIARETALADCDYGGARIAHGLTVSFVELTARPIPPPSFIIGSGDEKPLADP